MKIAFIGGGNMAVAMITGILARGVLKASEICVADRDISKLNGFQKRGIIITSDNQAAVDFADFVFFTIKPQDYDNVISALSHTANKVFVTVAPGITIKRVQRLCKAAIIRTMPNTPALVGEGATAICRGNKIKNAEFDFVKGLFSSFSLVYEIDESQMNNAVALSGSSPAYTYMFIDAIAKASVKAGINSNTATKIAAQSVLGAAKMILQTGESPLLLTNKVCSKGGTTIKAVETLESLNFADIIEKAMTACIERAKQMTNEQ